MEISSFSLLDLPPVDVVFTEIFPLLSLKDLFSLRSSSTSYKDLVDSYFPLCKNLDFSKTKSGEDLYKYVTEDNHNIKVLNLSNCKHWITDDLLIPVIARNKQLVEIDLTECTQLHDTIIIHIGKYCPNLTLLSLRACSWISKEVLKELVSKCNQLSHLDVEACWSLDDSCIEKIFESCPKLKYLNISRIYSLTSTSLDLIRLCRDIEEINLNGFWRLDDRDIRKVMEFCGKLRTIHLQGCTHVTKLSLLRLTLKNINYKGIQVPSSLEQFRPPCHRPIHLQI